MEPISTFGIIMLVLSAAATAVSTGLQYWSQNKINQENIDFAREAREDTQAFEQQAAATANAQTLQNFYMTQSPQAKMEMIKNAGLSPGLIYGNMASAGGAGAAQKASAASAPIPTLQNPFNGEYLNNLSKIMNEMADSDKNREKTDSDIDVNQATIDKINKEIEETNAKIKKLEEETKTEVVTRELTELDKKLKELEVKYQEATYEDRVKMVTEMLRTQKNTADKLENEIDILKIDKQYAHALKRATLSNLNAQTQKLIAEKALLVTQEQIAQVEKKLKEKMKELTEEQINEVKQNILNMKTARTKMKNETVKIATERQEEVFGWFGRVGMMEMEKFQYCWDKIKSIFGE